MCTCHHLIRTRVILSLTRVYGSCEAVLQHAAASLHEHVRACCDSMRHHLHCHGLMHTGRLCKLETDIYAMVKKQLPTSQHTLVAESAAWQRWWTTAARLASQLAIAVHSCSAAANASFAGHSTACTCCNFCYAVHDVKYARSAVL